MTEISLDGMTLRKSGVTKGTIESFKHLSKINLGLGIRFANSNVQKDKIAELKEVVPKCRLTDVTKTEHLIDGIRYPGKVVANLEFASCSCVAKLPNDTATNKH